jgi:hypothetical protein
MKRYYVDHRSGMTTDEEFLQISSLLAQEGLYDESRGRLYCLVRRPEGVLMEKEFLYLWKDRADAEAFAQKIPHRTPGIWRVFEEDVIPVYEFLDLKCLGLPERPRVVGIKSELYTDSLGEENLRLWVILADDTTEEEWAWPNLRSIKAAIQESLGADLRENGLDLWPIIWFKTESEYCEEQKQALAS